ncbi:23S rRNA (guanosine2251-2'-O)-methyltransferase [Microbacteriaceae bacterium MWH-Ta3]|nr:23S rRNA (guanosine2251-2'-O)-methyltransferase [Microbacteriaceae bacterium MWH-Ta3]
MAKPGRPGAAKGGKGPTKGTGGLGRRALEGRGPTPKAEDRSWHPAGQRKLAKERLEAARARHGQGSQGGTQNRTPKSKQSDQEIINGRNSVLEALRTGVPATTLYIAARVEFDDRVKESLALATKKGIPILEIMRPEMDRLVSEGSVHQGIALAIPPYQYAHPMDLLDDVERKGQTPLFVALDGITDPRNLGAIIRTTAAFGGHGIVLPQRRSVGVNAAAWKTSAGAAARTPVSMASNLTQTIKAFKDRGVFVIGLDGDGDVMLPALDIADRPLLIVVGSEGKGLSRLVSENCDVIVSIPISKATESLNAGIATSISLYEVAMRRQGAR